MHPKDLQSLATHTRATLLARAYQQGLKGISRLHKQDLLEILTWLLTADEPPTPSEIKSRIAAVNPRRSRKALLQQAQELPSSSVAVAPNPVPAERPDLPPVPAVVTPIQDVAESKFFLGAHATDQLAEPDTLPASYDDNRVVLLARDPHWLYAYWDFAASHFRTMQDQFGAINDGLTLKLFDVTHIEFNGNNAWNSTEIRLTPFASNWYIPVPQADTTYCVEIGYYSREGRFVTLGRSNTITTPRAELATSTEVQWFTPPVPCPAAALRESGTTSPLIRESRNGQQAAKEFSHPETITVPSPALSPAEHPFSWGAEHRREHRH